MVKLYKQKECEVYVRYDKDNDLNYPMYLCDSNGQRVAGGYILGRNGSRQEEISNESAKKAGIELDEEGRITADSLAEIVALIIQNQ